MQPVEHGINPTPGITLSSDNYNGSIEGSAVGGSGNVTYIQNVHYHWHRDNNRDPMSKLKGSLITSGPALTHPNEVSVSPSTVTSPRISDNTGGQTRGDNCDNTLDTPSGSGVVSHEEKSSKLSFWKKRRAKSESSTTQTLAPGPLSRNPPVVQSEYRLEDHTIAPKLAGHDPYQSMPSPVAGPSNYEEFSKDRGKWTWKPQSKNDAMISGNAGTSSSGSMPEMQHPTGADLLLTSRSRSSSVGLNAQPSSSRDGAPFVNSHQASGSRFPSSQEVPSSSNRPGGNQKAVANLLEIATKDPDSHITRACDGSVVAGNLQGLVDRLIWSSPNFRQDADYRDMFLTTYTAFTTADRLYQLLFQRYSESQAGICYNIVLVMKHWVKTPHVVVDMDVLQRMKHFALSIATGQIAELARQVVEGIDTRTNAPAPDLQSPGSDQCLSPSPDKIKPKDLAYALTVLEGEKYYRLLPADFIRHLLQPSSPNSIQAATDINNQIFTWVKMSVLIPEKYNVRAEVIKFFINTALECRKLGNFASVVAIVTALQSAPVTRLVVTMEEVQMDGRRSLETLSQLVSDVPVHKAYQVALENSKNSCVPWIAVHILELGAVLRKHEAVVVVDGRPLINFQRSMEIWRWVKKMSKYKEPVINHARYAEPLAYLESQLSKVLTGHSTDDALENRSMIFAQDEAKIHRYRIREFRSLGLPTS